MPRSGSHLLVLLLLLLVSVTLTAAQTEPTLTMNPNGVTPLAGVVELETQTPTWVSLTISDGIDSWRVDFPKARVQHYLPVLGMKSDRTYSVDVEVRPGNYLFRLWADTPPLPEDFPQVTTIVSDPQRMEPGFTMTDCVRWSNNDPRSRYSIIFDAAGEVVWYSTICGTSIHQLPNGNLLGLNNPFPREWDMLGNQRQVSPMADPGTGLHHDLERTPFGTHISLTRESVEVEDYPTSETDPSAPTETTMVTDDPVVEFLPDGTLRKKWYLTDLLAPTRIAYDSLRPRPEGPDWGHANASTYDPADDAIIVSLRHQDAVIKFSRETGELIWILGPHDNWPPEFEPYLLQPVGDPFLWQYHQHAPMVTGDGTLVLFDNGNNKASPFDGNPRLPDPQNFSRGVEYEIDETLMEVRQVWEYGENIAETLFSGFICDADWQPSTGNVLMTFGGTSYVGGVPSADLGLGQLHTRIVEATDDLVPERVFELMLHDPQGGRLITYRSERIPSLYPQVYLEPPHGIGRTLRVNKGPGSTDLVWTPSPVDPQHDAPEYYAIYASSAPDSGFAMVETAMQAAASLEAGTGSLFYRIVAANMAGTSGDEPAP